MSKRVQLTPFVDSDATQVGKTLLRKQLLPIAAIDHDGETLDFTKDYLKKLVTNFTAGKHGDQVPFMLVNEKNEHVDDPERFRGEAVAMELAGDGLYVTLDLSDDGEKLIDGNPKLGVSARIDRTDPDNPFIEHVAGTVNPVVKGMKPWEKVSLSDSEKAAEVQDLTEDEFAEAGDPSAGSDSPSVKDDFSDAERKQLTALLKKGGADAAKEALAEADISDEEVQETIDQILSAAEEEETETKEPVAALSKKDRDAIELAKTEASEAKEAARAARVELAEERFKSKRAELLQAGVPKSMIDLAEPVLKGEVKKVELSNGTKVDASNIVSKLLEEAQGTVDLSEVGVGAGDSEDKRDPAVANWAKGGSADDEEGNS